ncbi:hypothetical protein BpHYR1_014946 [Brachionus plicatilis]|uniref:Uncharacterized protein n=1 Tax=Brachionus plicatilis TaxID=10195 RepID=A0A3M7PU40_BRAPC|nr:hypothetical protein BpHYR1_014946 [Brachionus plicatilis]
MFISIQFKLVEPKPIFPYNAVTNARKEKKNINTFSNWVTKNCKVVIDTFQFCETKPNTGSSK